MRVRKQSPKYIDLVRLRADYGISESKAKRMIADGRIKVIHLVDEGRCRGRMLIVVDELDRSHEITGGHGATEAEEGGKARDGMTSIPRGSRGIAPNTNAKPIKKEGMNPNTK
jgi:hypothetical protein